MNKRPRRLLGHTFDGRPFFEPANAGSALLLAAAGGGKTTCAVIPALLSQLPEGGRALFIDDVKSGEVASNIAEVCEKYGRKFAVIDEFGERPNVASSRSSLNASGDLKGTKAGSLKRAGACDE